MRDPLPAICEQLNSHLSWRPCTLSALDFRKKARARSPAIIFKLLRDPSQCVASLSSHRPLNPPSACATVGLAHLTRSISHSSLGTSSARARTGNSHSL